MVSIINAFVMCILGKIVLFAHRILILICCFLGLLPDPDRRIPRRNLFWPLLPSMDPSDCGTSTTGPAYRSFRGIAIPFTAWPLVLLGIIWRADLWPGNCIFGTSWKECTSRASRGRETSLKSLGTRKKHGWRHASPRMLFVYLIFHNVN